MPQIIFEYSDNVIEKNMASLLMQIHQILSDKLPTELESCKSRIIKHHDFVVGNGDKSNAFIHLSIYVLKGRNPELLDSISSIILDKLKHAFQASLNSLKLQITISIQNLPDVYHKYQKT